MFLTSYENFFYRYSSNSRENSSHWINKLSTVYPITYEAEDHGCWNKNLNVQNSSALSPLLNYSKMYSGNIWFVSLQGRIALPSFD